MVSFPCPSKVDCEGSDYPIANVSIEGLDRPIFVCTWTHYQVPRLGGDAPECFPFCTEFGESYVSDADACTTAYQAALECAICHELEGNDEITVERDCPPDTFELGFPSSIRLCYGQSIYEAYQITGGHAPFTWDWTSVLNIPGVTAGYSTDKRTVYLRGTPTAPTGISIPVALTDANGSALAGNFVFECMQILTTTLPNFYRGHYYSAQIETSGTVGTPLFQIGLGSLPAGLTLSPTGLISGTPTETGHFVFTVVLNGLCSREYTLDTDLYYFTFEEMDGLFFRNVANPTNQRSLGNGVYDPSGIVAGKIGNSINLSLAFNLTGFGTPAPSNLFRRSITVRAWIRIKNYGDPAVYPFGSHNHTFLYTSSDITNCIAFGHSVPTYAYPPHVISCYIYARDQSGVVRYLPLTQNLLPADYDLWNRVLVVWDYPNQVLSLKVNNYAKVIARPAAGQVLQFTSQLEAFVVPQVSALLPDFAWIDELYIEPGYAWTDADALYDWNSGVGKTWPDVPQLY